MVFEIKGKYALVTGAAQGIGFQCSHELLENGVARLLIADVNEEKGKEAAAKLNKQYGDNKVLFVKCNVVQPEDFESIRFLTMCPGLTVTPLIEEIETFVLADFPNLNKTFVDDLAHLPIQQAENVAKGMMTGIRTGDNGSIWVSEGGQTAYEVQIPERSSLIKKQ